MIPEKHLLEVLEKIQNGIFNLHPRNAHSQSRALIILSNRGWVGGLLGKPFVTPLGEEALRDREPTTR